MNISNFTLFILFGIGAIIIFVVLLKYLSKTTEKKDISLFKHLSDVTGFQYYEENDLGVKQKIRGMFDFGLSELPIKRMAHGKYSNNNIYFFEIDDEAISTGLKSWITPTWSVCLLESSIPAFAHLGVMYFHSKITFGKLKKYKSFSLNWQNVELANPKLKNYRLMTTDKETCSRIIDKGLIEIFSEYARKFRGKLLPRHITLQINEKYIAVYGDLCNFDKINNYIICFDCIKEVYRTVYNNKS